MSEHNRETVELDRGFALRDLELQLLEYQAKDGIAVDGSRRRMLLEGVTREVQKVAGKRMHPIDTVEDESEEQTRILIQFPLIFSGKQLAIARDHAQRLLQIVRCDARKALKILIRILQSFGLLPKLILPGHERATRTSR